MRHQLTFEAILLAIVGGVVGIGVAVYATRSPQQLFIQAMNPQAVVNHVPLTTPIPEPQKTVVSQLSSDGEKMVLLRGTTNNDGSTSYSLVIANGDGSDEQVLFREVVGAGESIVIPFNTWSHDNRYFFIQKQTKEGPQVLIFNESGEAFSNRDFYLDATEIFTNRQTGFDFAEATGWASNSLLLINTTTTADTKGPSFWLEVPSQAVIRLSTEF